MQSMVLARRRRGFTIIELLIVIGTLGVLVTTAIPGFLNSMQRAKQRRTMSDMRIVAAAVEAYQADWDAYPAQHVEGPLATVRANLEPTYSVTLPVRDGWGNDLAFVTAADAPNYLLTSHGRDGLPSGPGAGPIANFSDDLILSGGVFLTWPIDGASR